MGRRAGAITLLLASALLAGCGARSDDEDTGSGSGAGSGSNEPSSSSPSSTGSTSTGGVGTGPRTVEVDGALELRVDGGVVFITALAGDEPLVVLADLSTAQVTADGSSWRVMISRPDGAQDPQADTPGSWDAVVVQAGDTVEVGRYELGPRPPRDVELCLEALAPRPDQRSLATGDQVRLEDRRGDTTYVCGSATVQ